MSELVLQAIVEGPLLGVNARIAGAAVVLGTDPSALSTLVEVAAGVRAPRRGHAVLDGAVLHASPERRRVTAALLANEALPAFGNVGDATRAILAARGDRRDAAGLLREVGFDAWSARRSRDLDASERRAFMLALALTHENPRLLVLFEPFAAGRGLPADFVRRGIARAIDAGAVVVLATQSIDDARAFGGVPWLFDRGVLANAPGAPLGSPPGVEPTFVVETPDARRLTAALARDPVVRGVRWNERLAPETLFVFGSDVELVARAILRVVSEESAHVHRLELSSAPLDVLAATAAYAIPAPYAMPAPTAYPYGAPPQAAAYPHGAPAPYPPGPAFGTPPPAAPSTTAPSPADQSVSMPTAFFDPTRPPGGGGS